MQAVQNTIWAIPKITFPHGNDLPAKATQIILFAFIASYVSVKFFGPEFAVCLRKRIVAFWAAMPVAAVNEDRNFLGNESNVRPTGNLFVVEAIAAIACVPKGFPKRDFRL